ncbi:MAG: hypothetical protein N3G77_01155 [Nitrososphaeria archaeon]|nr:hypothetical protein [Nitrososphaeria archaeon]MDW7986607.1 hypothetical protein [Nitrososphaerota archaeon]
MSWFLAKKKAYEQPSVVDVLFGVNFVVKKIGEDILVEGRARTLSDIMRLKRLAEEIFNELIREYEGKRASPVTLRHR